MQGGGGKGGDSWANTVSVVCGAAGHSCVSFPRFCYVIVEIEFPRKRTCGELRSAAPVGTPHLMSDTVYAVNTDLCLQWLQLLDYHVTATESDAVPLASHSVISR